ncbi:MAG: cell division protein FtsA [Bacteroidetes bacterium]|nr:cell division protein FtsA [Bacteroidota bacterium]
MKNEQPIIVGLDIGTTKVVAIAGRKNEYGKLEILGMGKVDSAGISHGVVMNIDQCVRSVELAIEKCIQSNPNLEIKEVYVGIAGQHIKSRQTKGERVRVNPDEIITRDDINMLVRDQYKTYIPAGDQIIDVIEQDFSVDNSPSVLDPVGMTGAKMSGAFHVITGDGNAIRNIKRCVDSANLITRDLILQPLASAAAVITDEDLEAGVAIVDIGGGTTDMAVFYDGMLKHTAVIPYAGVNITNDIRLGLGVLRAQAEQMKIQFGMALADEANANAYITIPGLRGLEAKEISVKNLANIIQARTQEILDHVMSQLRQINLDRKLHGGIILTGGGAQLKHLVQLTEYMTGLSCRIGFPNEHLAGGHISTLMNPMYATCIGLILEGCDDFESGNLRFTGDTLNLVRISSDDLSQTEELDGVTSKTEMTEEEQFQDGQKKRRDGIRSLIGRFKGKLMRIFEEEEDNEIE